MAKITTTGELRAYLCEAITNVTNGTMDLDKARAVVKLASQVTENLYAECKMAKLKIDLQMEADKFGSAPLGK